MGTCDGRVVVITGAARGLGRAHALAFAAEGARVVVNDTGVGLGGDDPDDRPAQQVVDEILAAGGDAIANFDDVADFEAAGSMISSALRAWGRLDSLVCNAGIVRDRMLVNMSVDEWDAVVRVHLRGTFCPIRNAASHWRAEAKSGREVTARIVTTSSGAGLFGSVGQANYSAAKAGIAALTSVAAVELSRYGIAVNSIAPAARSRMTETAFSDDMKAPETGFDVMDPANVSPLVVWLGSERCSVTGRMFEVSGGEISLADGWRHGVRHLSESRYDPSDLDDVIGGLVSSSEPPTPVYGA